MSIKGGRGALCVQIDFTRTFQTTTKCNNINHVALLLQHAILKIYYKKTSKVSYFELSHVFLEHNDSIGQGTTVYRPLCIPEWPSCIILFLPVCKIELRPL